MSHDYQTVDLASSESQHPVTGTSAPCEAAASLPTRGVGLPVTLKQKGEPAHRRRPRQILAWITALLRVTQSCQLARRCE